MPTHPLTTPFTPDEGHAARIIDSMTDPDTSLRGIAIQNNTTLESLTRFLASPDIQERLDNLHSAIAHRTRLAAANSLPAAVNVLTNMLRAYTWEESKITVHPSDKRAVQQRRIAGESTRRAAHLLFRLANFRPSGAGFQPARATVSQPSRPGVPNSAVARPSRPGVPRPPAPTLQELLARIQQLAPTLLDLDEPHAPARAATLVAPQTPALSSSLSHFVTQSLPQDEPDAQARATAGDSQQARDSSARSDCHPAAPSLMTITIAQFNQITGALFELFPQLPRPSTDPILDIPDEIFYPAVHHVQDCLTENHPVQITPGNPLDNLKSYLATALPAGPAP